MLTRLQTWFFYWSWSLRIINYDTHTIFTRELKWENPRSEYCVNCTNEVRWSWFAVGTPLHVLVKRVSFWNEACPSSPALTVIWCDWMEFRGKGNIWEPNRDRMELMFVNQWVSGSQTSLDIQRANNSVCFSELPRSRSWLPECSCEKCDWLSNTHVNTQTRRVLIQEWTPLRVVHIGPLIQRAGT